MLPNGLSYRVIERFAASPVNNWQELAGFSLNNFSMESGLNANHLSFARTLNDSLVQEYEQVLRDKPPVVVDAITDYMLMHHGATFLNSLGTEYPGISLIEAAKPMRVAGQVGFGLLVVHGAVAHLAAGYEATRGPEIAAQVTEAAVNLKALVPDVRTDAVLGYVEAFQAIRPDIRSTVAGLISAVLGDTSTAVEIAPDGASKPN